MNGPSTSGEGGGPVDEMNILENFEKFTVSGYKCVQEGVGASCLLPEGAIYKMCATEDKFRLKMKESGQMVLDLMQMILEQTTVNGRFGDYSLDEKQELLVDANDSLLDRAHQNMDILEGIREMVEIESTYHRALSGSWNRPPPSSAARHQQQQITAARDTHTPPSSKSQPPPEQRSSVPVLHMAKVTTRPQILFKDKIDNSNTPWVPGIKEKPNSLKPLAVLIEVNEEGYESYSHPYEYELDHWSPPPNQLKYQRPELPRSLENTPYSYIETPEQLDLMMAELKDQNALAVDLEHHSYRSFMGFTCTLQISTKAKDYIVDALTLRHRLHILNEIFTNPKIVKVFHGAENDIEWLQRDLAVYVVNMFDTYQAAKLLQCPKLNLAYLLHHYCQLDTDKHFQLYDWRTRPLSEKAVIYAREDTHYLLYIYSRMTNELLKASNNNTNLLESVYQRSTETCKRKYTKPLLEEDSHMVTYRKGKRLMDNRQLFALKELYLWRDTIARREDESPGYVLPNHMMLQMADTLPREMQGVLACCNPIPTLVRQYVMELHQIMLRAREQPLVKAIPDQRIIGGGGSGVNQLGDETAGGIVVGRLFDCDPTDFRDDLPTILDSASAPWEAADEHTQLSDVQKEEKVLMKPEPWLPLGAVEADKEYSKKIMKSWTDIENTKLLNVYQRYKLVLPYSNQIEKERQEQEEKEAKERERKRIEAEERRSQFLKEKELALKKEDEEVVDIPISQKYHKGKRKSYEGQARNTPDKGPSEAKRQQLTDEACVKDEGEEAGEGVDSILSSSSKQPPHQWKKNKKKKKNGEGASFMEPVSPSMATVMAGSSDYGKNNQGKKRRSSGGDIGDGGSAKKNFGKKPLKNSLWQQHLTTVGCGSSAKPVNPYENVNFNKFSMAGQSHLQHQQTLNYIKVPDALRPKRKKKQQFGGKNMNFKKKGGRH